MTEVVVNDHEVCFRDGGESFTFRTKAAPGKGGDAGMRERSDFMNEELGFVYGPYNNFTDFFGVPFSEVEAIKKPTVISTSTRDVIEEYLATHQHLDREIDGRLTLIR